MHQPTSPTPSGTPDFVARESPKTGRRQWRTPRVIRSEIEETEMPGPGGSGEGSAPFSVS